MIDKLAAHDRMNVAPPFHEHSLTLRLADPTDDVAQLHARGVQDDATRLDRAHAPDRAMQVAVDVHEHALVVNDTGAKNGALAAADRQGAVYPPRNAPAAHPSASFGTTRIPTVLALSWTSLPWALLLEMNATHPESFTVITALRFAWPAVEAPTMSVETWLERVRALSRR